VIVRKLMLFVVCSLVVAVGSANAQSEARIRGLLPKIDHAEDDLKWLIDLSPTADLKKQWKNLKENVLDALTQGMHLDKPVEIDLVFRKDELSYEYRIPVKDLEGRDGLLANLKASGFTKVNEVTKGVYYEFSEKGKKPYYLRLDRDYAWISQFKAAVPSNPPLATQDMGELLNLKKDVVGELKNTAEGMDPRRENFKELRKQFESVVKQRRNENENSFELRKLSLIQQLNEAERFLVESEKLLVTWTTATDGANPHGRGELSFTPLPGTDLQKSLEEFAVKPSYFANVELHPNPIFTGKMNFAVDSTRAKHSKEFYKAARPVIESEIDARSGETAEQKAATKKAMNIFLDMLDAGTELHVLDAFIDGHTPAPEKNVLICGIRAADGKVADEILKLLPEMKAGWQVDKTPEEHAGVSIHKLTVPPARTEQFKKFFAGESVMYVGTSKDAVWGAAGLDAVKHLKDAIDQAAKPAPEKADPVVVNYQVHVAKVSKFLDAIKPEPAKEEPPKTKDQERIQKDKERAQKAIEKYHDLAQKAMAGCDSLMHGELKRNGNTMDGFLEVNECVLKYIGTMMANGVKETMQ